VIEAQARVTLLVAENRIPFVPDFWERLLGMFPESMQTIFTRFRRWEDRQASLLARLMLVDRFGPDALLRMKMDSFGRPALPGCEFNLSHTDGIVVLAVAEERVGVDVEYLRPVDLAEVGSALSESEKRQLAESTDVPGDFFALWTAKESAVKADGRGMTIPFDTVHVAEGVASIEETAWRLTPVSLGQEFACHVAVKGNHTRCPAEVTVTPFLPTNMISPGSF
jgi:4'-phosphopantetheinyl transferase